MKKAAPYCCIEDLPKVIPIFPLPGVLLLPRGKLPLNIFEPRYLEMVQAAIGSHRLIGMVQPVDPEASPAHPEVHRIGCAGRITTFAETDDGRFLVTLAGIARFEIERELPMEGRLHRRVEVNFTRFADDLAEPPAVKFDRNRLIPALKDYFQLHGLTADWQSIERAPDNHLLTCLAMICPFRPNEKQALLEYPSDFARAQAVISLLEMAALEALVAPSSARLQ
ncbi:MAG: peptidase S16 [Alphaproteobacteria bacterium]|nr:peptidase S16 [Alphaproteobacteria bacterium]